MYFLVSVVFGLLLFMILYGRYMNVSGNIGQRRLQIDNLRDEVEFKVGKLQKGTLQINREIADAASSLESLKKDLDNARGKE
ncbi:hypothetical protein [Maridesulfovibrio sp.]|uniref:hypothetical protein n=1 Tax=Maridesulfovibrio sp. TaxID=2795000 RepID=UPI0029C9BD5F|nr:hypothetical protein [Maridesulfovibrio sp.]